MATMQTLVGLTAEEFAQLDLRGRHELVRGVVIEMSFPKPRHALVESRITFRLMQFAESAKTGYVLHTGYVVERGPDTVRGPDVAFIDTSRLASEGDLDRYVEGAPDLAVEILSPTNRAGEIARKVREYLAAGARLVWVVDTRRRIVTVHIPGVGPSRVAEGEVLDGGDVLPGFTMPVADIFAL
ncbi:MAG: Uma2 family endonuclease [Ardenticatenales bacterium]|nr:Uma2 family endonuclease [Ardenticatenales bacterium]